MMKHIFKNRLFKREHEFTSAATEYAEIERYSIEEEDIAKASVVVSMTTPNEELHLPVLDLDVEHYYFPSTTPGHGHLYINVPIKWEMYKEVLDVLAKAGIIESNYAEVSKVKGYSAVRLPWVKKEI